MEKHSSVVYGKAVQAKVKYWRGLHGGLRASSIQNSVGKTTNQVNGRSKRVQEARNKVWHRESKVTIAWVWDVPFNDVYASSCAISDLVE
jgi:hypothetical protein